MIILQKFIKNKSLFLALLCAFFSASITKSYAGFEWIPQKKEASKQEESPMVEAPLHEEVSHLENVVLPLPSQNDQDKEKILNEEATTELQVEAMMEEKPKKQAPVKPAIEAQIETQGVDTDMPMVAAERFMAPARMAMTPKEEPNSGSVAKASDEPLLLPLIEDEASTQPVDLTEAPVKIEMHGKKVVMPEDAPISLLEQTESREKKAPEIQTEQTTSIQIAAFPESSDLQETANTPMPTFMASAEISESKKMVFPEAVGFATDIPLALALRQIVPADYSYAFGEGVNPGLRVSWNGGKPWNEVVSDMISPLGYSVLIQNKSVRISLQKMGEIPALIEPAAGDTPTDENFLQIISDTPFSEESQGEPIALIPAERSREIKRIGITDPGMEESTEALIPLDG